MWLVFIGALFIPVIMTGIQVMKPVYFSTNALQEEYWPALLVRAWEFMGVLLLPFGVILVTSLIAQIEFRNHSWKLVCVTPQSLKSIFFAKLTVIGVLMLLFFLLFNVALYLNPYLAMLLNHDLEYPATAFPLTRYASESWAFFITCLPIVGLQYLVSLRFGNFLVSIGTGLILIILSLFLFKWEYGYFDPYTYTFYHFVGMSGNVMLRDSISIYALSFVYFGIFAGIALMSFLFGKVKG